MSVSADRLEAIQTRVDAATEGPWRLSETPYSNMVYSDHVQGRRLVSHPPVQEDADFIAHAREDVPYLLGRVRSLEESADRYVNWHEPRIIPTAEIPNQRAALDALRAVLDVDSPATLPCGHGFDQAVTGDEGTSYCGACADSPANTAAEEPVPVSPSEGDDA